MKGTALVHEGARTLKTRPQKTTSVNKKEQEIFGTLHHPSLKTQFFFAVSIWKMSSWGTHFGFQGLDIKSTPCYASSSVAKAETIEGLFDGILSLWTAVSADAADITARDLLLELPLAENHTALDPLSCRTSQEDVGSMASTLQQRGWHSTHRRRSLATNFCGQERVKLNIWCEPKYRMQRSHL